MVVCRQLELRHQTQCDIHAVDIPECRILELVYVYSEVHHRYALSV